MEEEKQRMLAEAPPATLGSLARQQQRTVRIADWGIADWGVRQRGLAPSDPPQATLSLPDAGSAQETAQTAPLGSSGDRF
eukprot:2805164-Alexandrium_andersonii.AAC.1